jgi:BatD DUF11 like domain
MTRSILITFCVLLASLVMLASPARGQGDDVTVEASVSDERATLGGGVLYTILVKGTTTSAEPVLGDMDGFDVEYLGPTTSTQSTIVLRGGKNRQVRKVKTTYRYLVTPTREGALRISPATVIVDGKQYETKAIWIEASKPQELEDFKFRLTTESTTVYVNQPIAVRATWYVGANVQSFVWNAPDSDAFSVVLPPSTRSTPAPSGGNPVPVRIGREEVYGERGADMLAGRAFTTVSVDLIVIPTAPGTVTFGPMSIRFDRPVRSSNSFIRTTVNRREIVASNELPFEVQRVPSAEAPVGYGGLVGQYDINASINTRDVNVGDPIELTVHLAGDPFVMPGAAPDLSKMEAITDAFKLSPDGWREEPTGRLNERLYRTTIRATNERVDQVPPIVLHYFDPESGEFRTARSPRLPLTVRATREVTAADAIGVMSAATVEASPLLSARAGLPANRTGPEVLRSDRPSVLAFAATPLGGALLGGPVVLYGVVVLAGVRKRRDDRRHRRRRALAHAKRQLRRAPPATAAALAVQSYIADRFDLHDRAITGHDCHTVLNPIDADIAKRLKAILVAHETGTFGHAASPGKVELASVRADLTTIDRLLRKEDR